MIIKQLRVKPGIGDSPQSLTIIVEHEGQDVEVTVDPPPPPGKVRVFLHLLALEVGKNAKVES